MTMTHFIKKAGSIKATNDGGDDHDGDGHDGGDGDDDDDYYYWVVKIMTNCQQTFTCLPQKPLFAGDHDDHDHDHDDYDDDGGDDDDGDGDYLATSCSINNKAGNRWT